MNFIVYMYGIKIVRRDRKMTLLTKLLIIFEGATYVELVSIAQEKIPISLNE